MKDNKNLNLTLNTKRERERERERNVIFVINKFELMWCNFTETSWSNRVAVFWKPLWYEYGKKKVTMFLYMFTFALLSFSLYLSKKLSSLFFLRTLLTPLSVNYYLFPPIRVRILNHVWLSIETISNSL